MSINSLEEELAIVQRQKKVMETIRDNVVTEKEKNRFNEKVEILAEKEAELLKDLGL